MPWFGDLKTKAITAIVKSESPAFAPAWVGLFTRAAAKAVTSETTKIIKLTAHGFATGDIIVFTTLNGGAGLVVGRPYFVKEVTVNSFELTQEKGGTTTEAWTTEVIATSEVGKITEISGGAPAYKRVASGFAAALVSKSEDTTTRTLNVPASTVNYVTYHTLETAGSPVLLCSVTQEVISAQATYQVTNGTIDLLGVA